jgi:putative phosphoesterase
LPDDLLDGLEGCDLILHLGDLNAHWVLEQLGEIAPVRAVHGNNDEPDLMRKLPRERIFQIGRWKIGMLHGHGPPRTTAKQVVRESMLGRVDCAVYGHSHRADDSEFEGMRMVNPGSPTQPRWVPARTFGIMRIDDEIDVTIFDLR